MALEALEEAPKGAGPVGIRPPPPFHSDQLLDWERIMCNRRADTLEMPLRIKTGDVTRVHLGVTLPDFTEWAYTNWAGWHDIGRLERMCHTNIL